VGFSSGAGSRDVAFACALWTLVLLHVSLWTAGIASVCLVLIWFFAELPFKTKMKCSIAVALVWLGMAAFFIR
jgi:hypothetical protein